MYNLDLKNSNRNVVARYYNVIQRELDEARIMGSIDRDFNYFFPNFLRKVGNKDIRVLFIDPDEMRKIAGERKIRVKQNEKFKEALEDFRREIDNFRKAHKDYRNLPINLPNFDEWDYWQDNEKMTPVDEYRRLKHHRSRLGDFLDKYDRLVQECNRSELTGMAEDDLSKIVEKARELYDDAKYVEYETITMGLFVSSPKSKQVIYICLENIEKKAWDKAVRFETFAQSVLVHELVHFIHTNFKVRKCSNRDNKSAVMSKGVDETIAEYIQLGYILKQNAYGLERWIKNHSEVGIFPGWGYAGAAIINCYCGNYDKGAQILKKIIAASIYEWEAAYGMICALDVL